MEIIISQPLEKEAKDYALKSRSYTSNRHDFHEGGLEAKERKMFEGKLGEKAIKQFFTEGVVELVVIVEAYLVVKGVGYEDKEV